MSHSHASIVQSFNKKTVAILGDLVADQFLNGTISRVSREAPVFILKHDVTNTVPGAAANAAANVASLGGIPLLVGVIGDDENGRMLLASLDAAGVATDGIVVAEGFRTTTKVRVLAAQHYAARQQVIRIDYADDRALPQAVREAIARNFAAIADRSDAIIVSDYDYGAVFPELFGEIVKNAGSRRPVIVDSRFRLASLVGAATATPNREEVEQILGKGFGDRECEGLRERLGCDALLVTNGNQGMSLFEKNAAPVQIDAVGATEPIDVTGAGDTVIAAYSLGLGAGMSFFEAARIANHAGGLVVMKKGTATVSGDELIRSLEGSADGLATSRPPYQ